jgi:Helix-turn-helix domain
MAKSNSTGLNLAAKEHLVSGQPLTRLEALVLYGVSNLPELVYEMRKQGWTIENRSVAYAAAMVRINKFATLTPPSNLPIREIQLTEYWIAK